MHVEHGASGFSDYVQGMLPRIERVIPTVRRACANLDMVKRSSHDTWDKYAMLMGLLAEHDPLTMQHTQQVVEYTQKMLEELKNLAAENAEYETLYRLIENCNPIEGAMLHDIGKLFIPRYILNRREKNGITPDEHNLLIEHGHLGQIIIERLELPVRLIPFCQSHFFHALDKGMRYVPHDFHDALSLVAIADISSAIMTPRPYNKFPSPHETLRRQLLRRFEQGIFNPLLIQPFERMMFPLYTPSTQ